MREAQRNGKPGRRWPAAAVAALLLGSLVVPAGSGAVAAPGNPGVPGPAQEVYREGFENATGAPAIRLPAYVGAEGERYTSDPFWVMQDQCNGVVLRYDGTVYPAGYCTTGNGAQNNVRRMADVLGQVEAGVVGSTNPAAPVEASTPQSRANHAVTAWTGNVNGPSNAITLETPQFDLAGQGARFFTASVNVAELSCTFQGGANNSRLTFALVSGGRELMLTNTPIRACTDTQVRYYTSPTLPGGWGNGGAYVAAGRFFADSSYLVDPDLAPTMSLRMRNLTGSSSGNDFAYDEVRLFDATPQLDKSFSPSSVPVNGRSTLTFTVTNTDDLAEKRGWGFVDTLPAGLVVADPANIGGSCSATTTAAPGSGVITIEDGVLAADEASCTVTVEVTSPAPGPSEDSPVVYANCPANVQTFGLDAPACATVEFFTEPHLTLAKQHDGTGASRPGDTVRYTVTATNDGTGDYTAADPAVVVDDLTGVLDDAAFVDGSLRAEIGGVPVGPPARSGDRIAWQGPLRVGQTVTISYEVVLGSGGDHRVRNVAFPSETPFDPDAPPPTPACGEAGSVCTELLLPAIRLEKSTQETSMSWGGRLHYVFTVTNTGQVPLDEIRIDETAFDGSGEMSAIVCDATSLQPGASTSCRATYTVTGADMDRGSLDNTATATGTPPAGDPVVSAPDDHRLTGERTPKLTIEKFSNATALVAGERISFWFVVRNEGNVTIRDLVVTEERFTGSGAPPEISCPGDELAAFTQMTCRASYLVTQEDVDRGELVNTASVTGTDPEGEPVDGGESTVDVPTQPAPGLQIRKTTATQTLIAGEDITYWFQVRNTGNMTLDEITVVETEFSGSGTLSAITCQRTTLPPQDTTWCRADYTVTQADVDAGFIENAATATGVTRDGADVTANESEQRIPSQQAPALTLEKTADAAELVVGETVTYTFRVTNTGNVTVGNVRIKEISFDGNGALGAIECPADRPLAPTESLNCTAEYEVVQADLDQGGVRNTAVAEGTRPGGETVASAPDDATVPGGGAPALTIEKTADPARMTAGGLITYTFLIRNSGNVTVTDVSVVEGGFTGSGALGAISCPDDARRLAPGESVRCTAAYRATQADVDRGSIDNSATASGTAPGGAAVESAPDDARVTAEPAPALRLVKSADTDTLVAGETVIYTFVVTNTGNVTLTGVLITEDEWTGDGDAPEVVCPADQAASLAPGAELRCTAEYLVTQADVDAGEVSNQAGASGQPPRGDRVFSPPSSVRLTTDSAPALTVVKSVEPDELVAGETITYRFVVTNTGNVTLHDVRVREDAFTGAGALGEPSCAPAELQAALPPDEQLVCTAEYVVQQADVDRGSIRNTATALGTPPGADEPVESERSDAAIPAEPDPRLSLRKTASTGQLVAGETITYTFAITNTGNVTLRDVTVAEGSFTGAGELSEIRCPAEADALVPGRTVRCTADYFVQQADVDRGSIENTATALGTPPGADEPVESEPSDATVTAEPEPSFELVKATEAESFRVGDTITYTFEVRNTGNVTLRGIAIDELDFSGDGELSAINCPPEAAALPPGETVVCTADYAPTQGDVERGRIDNTAAARATPPQGDELESDPSEASVPAERIPGIAVVKSADRSELVAGETITYTFVVTNTGNVSLRDIAVDEGAFSGAGELSDVSCPGTGPLAPGEQLVCTAEYVVQQADVDRGSIENTATARGTPPGGEPTGSEPSSARVPQDPAPAIALVKTASTERITTPGQRVRYEFLVTNTGNVTLDRVRIAESEFTGHGELPTPSCPEGPLAPGQSVRCTTTYTVVAADLSGAPLRNTATATAEGPGGSPVAAPPSTAELPAALLPAGPRPGALAWSGFDAGPALLVPLLLLLLGAGAAAISRRPGRRRAG